MQFIVTGIIMHLLPHCISLHNWIQLLLTKTDTGISNLVYEYIPIDRRKLGKPRER
jgi:hypothetical protein